MVNIRKESINDIEIIGEINNLAFKGEGEAKLIAGIRESENFIPELSLLAEKDGEIIGHILFSIVYIETLEGEIPTLALAPMAVIPEFQNQGIGSLLVREGLKKCQELGYKHVTVLGHPNFYPKFGFVPSVSKEIHAPFKVPEEVFMVIELEKDSLTKIHGKVKYPPAFDVV